MNIQKPKSPDYGTIFAKKEREGKKYKPAKPGDPDRPDPESFKKHNLHKIFT
jgi:hypothetical protein